jgi:hypothetical protein
VPASSRWFTNRGDISSITTTLRIASVALAGAGEVPIATSFISAISSASSGRRKARLPNDARNASRQLAASGDVPAQLPASDVSRWLVLVAPSATALATVK